MDEPSPPLFGQGAPDTRRTPWGVAVTCWGSWARWHSVLFLFLGQREVKLGVREGDRRAQGHPARGGRGLGSTPGPDPADRPPARAHPINGVGPHPCERTPGVSLSSSGAVAPPGTEAGRQPWPQFRSSTPDSREENPGPARETRPPVLSNPAGPAPRPPGKALSRAAVAPPGAGWRFQLPLWALGGLAAPTLHGSPRARAIP